MIEIIPQAALKEQAGLLDHPGPRPKYIPNLIEGEKDASSDVIETDPIELSFISLLPINGWSFFFVLLWIPLIHLAISKDITLFVIVFAFVFYGGFSLGVVACVFMLTDYLGFNRRFWGIFAGGVMFLAPFVAAILESMAARQ